MDLPLRQYAFFLALFLLVFCHPAFAQGESLSSTWETRFSEDMLQQAQQENKRILLYFSGSDWCRPCIQLKKKIFDSTEFLEFADKQLILVQLDFPAKKKSKLSAEQTAHNEAMAEKYNPKGAFPMAVVLDSDGQQLGAISGYKGMSISDYLAQLSSLWQPADEKKNQ